MGIPVRSAQDIIATLRKQWAHLFQESLRLRNQTKASRLSGKLLDLQGEALRLVIEQPIAWEYRLFSEVLSQELEKSSALRMDLDYNVAIGKGEHFEFPELFIWLRGKAAELSRLISSLNQLFNVALQEALGPPGVAGNPESIVYVATKLGEAHRHAMEWTLEFQRLSVDEELQTLVNRGARLSHNMIKEIEDTVALFERLSKT